jgi:hypothetical protein
MIKVSKKSNDNKMNNRGAIIYPYDHYACRVAIWCNPNKFLCTHIADFPMMGGF